MSRLFKYAMFFTAFIPLWITILFLDIMSITDETNNYIGSEVVGIGCIAIGFISISNNYFLFDERSTESKLYKI